MSWERFDGGPRGSEGGVVIADEEYRSASRITLERDCRTRIPAAITCGIYGWMMHTRFFSDVDVARRAYEAMKVDLAEIVDRIPPANDPAWRDHVPAITEAIGAFVEKYPT